MATDTRRAQATWMLTAADGKVQRGESEAVIDDAGLNVGLAGLSFLDVDGLRAAEHRIELALWPGGGLLLSGLGRRHETFLAELRRARNRARVAGLLAHAPAQPEVFEGAQLAGGAAVPAELQVYSTHLAIVPVDADPWQLPLGAIEEIAASEDPPAVVVKAGGVVFAFGQLARRRDAFLRSLAAAREAQSQLLERLTGSRAFGDGLGVARDALAGFDSLLRNFSAPERLEGARAILGKCAAGEPRLGFVQLLDPDADALAARVPLPGDWASFLLAPVGNLVVLEILAGPSAATYVFAGDIGAINRDLQALHFRRGALALREEEAKVTPDNPHRLALRRLAPLQRLRAATRARVIHDGGWGAALERALGTG